MNILLIFFALPIAVIIISAILQKLLKCPIMVAALIFAIFLVVTFIAFDETFLIATLAYTILAFITALFVRALCQSNNNNSCLCEALTNLLNNTTGDNTNSNTAVLNDILSSINNLNTTNNSNNENNNSCGCGCRYNRYRRF